MRHLSQALFAVPFAFLLAVAPVSAQTLSNAAPTADAGPDKTVASGTTVALDGSESSDSDGSISAYSWYGYGVPLRGANPSFTAPTLAPGAADRKITFILLVTDNDRVPSSDAVVITVEAPNARPAANAGPDRTVASGATVTLDGFGSSDSDGLIASYVWAAPVGIALSDVNAPTPTFTAPGLATGAADVPLTFTLAVTDDDGAIVRDTVVITVDAANGGPNADAGPDRTVASGAAVSLDGSSSGDGDGTIATYAWTQTDGTSVTLTGTNTAALSFDAPDIATGAADTIVTFLLLVTDNEGATATDTVVITVEAPNAVPTADAGHDQTVDSGARVTLDGSASNDDGDLDGDGSITGYEWTASDGVTLTGANTASPSFTAPTLAAGAADVTRTFTLTVTDNDGGTATDTMVITVESPNAAPTANAGPPQTVASGTTVTLDGSGSNDDGDLDDDGSIASYTYPDSG